MLRRPGMAETRGSLEQAPTPRTPRASSTRLRQLRAIGVSGTIPNQHLAPAGRRHRYVAEVRTQLAIRTGRRKILGH